MSLWTQTVLEDTHTHTHIRYLRTNTQKVRGDTHTHRRYERTHKQTVCKDTYSTCTIILVVHGWVKRPVERERETPSVVDLEDCQDPMFTASVKHNTSANCTRYL